MYVRYGVYLDAAVTEHRKWSKRDKSCFEEIKDAKVYIKETYFFLRESPPPVWVSVLGHEKSSGNKKIIGRVWIKSWAFHVCVNGKGYYNNTPIERGCCFISWPYVKHNIVSDENDPLEFYWIILRGSQMMDFVQNCGFSASQLVFKIDCVDDMIQLFETAMNLDYNKFNISDTTLSFAKLLLSFSKEEVRSEQMAGEILEKYGSYTKMAKQLLSGGNYALTVEEVANKLGISSKHLSRVFYNDTGETLKQYIIRKRFDLAVKLMKDGMSSVEIAKLVGYSSYSAYLRKFSSIFSMTPTEFSESKLNSDGNK